MNTIIGTGHKPNKFLQFIGATSWNDAVLCLLVLSFLVLFIVSFVTVVGTFILSFFSGITFWPQ